MFATWILVLTIGLWNVVHSEDQPNYLKSYDDDVTHQNLNSSRFRLSNDIRPTYYTLELMPGEAETFYGVLQIDFEVLKTVELNFQLNAENIQVSAAYLFRENAVPTFDGNLVRACWQDEDLAQYQLLQCDLDTSKVTALNAGTKYELWLVYEGKYGTDMRGLYKSTYKDSTGQKRSLFTTHFGQQARRMLPCWDEPRFKAPFYLLVHRDPNRHNNSISMANIEQTVAVEGELVDVYKPTAPISPYILAVTVSDFQLRSDAPRDQHKVGVFARSNAYAQSEFSFELGSRLMGAFDEWTNMSYYDFESVDKMDMVAVPDFSAGGLKKILAE